ncbi:anti-sigma factor [Paenibacillus sp. HB172176]|uniref:anti-sigma factor n=1 Tax=Paenibacillus sp. HB172176 TaxID=2493690 RepID=UPI00143AD599|nr:anti-sigma factor [Paenibacillus sp. HB172176]
MMATDRDNEWSGGGCAKGYGEQEWIDLILGKQAESVERAMRSHLSSCPACDAQYREWRELLAVEEVPETAGEAWEHEQEGSGQRMVESGKELAHERTADARTLLPPTRYQSLLGEVSKLKRRSRRKRWGVALALPAFAAAVIVALTLFLPAGDGKPASRIDEYVMRQEPAALAVLRNENTSKYRIAAAEGRAGEGYLWFNVSNNEAFLLLDRLTSGDEVDYQAWAITGDRRDSLGLITLSGTQGHLYMRTDLLRMADTIALSAEPKGGSPQPTTEQMVLLVLQ